ncbi:sigma 54-interacting transcriptional regulator [Geomonas paludis]|uniref:HTH-type transcriptional regulatory protein TyrR n=1 Tax=Geomonas paludis TaxID=2740185 RepID=A0A6V8MTF6_9BACT|nr:sigma 54-interacting transcriptional regulator [Geomonas paludis]UPU35281.1 sigma 54-interacting transcriptional regulator [Geomonas paludis]GFO63174.1 Fis family transcriptional regulator [Geomonas paludis]
MDINLKLKLLFTDRAGILASLAALMAAEQFNICGLDVEREEGRATLYLEAEGQEQGRQRLIDAIAALPDLLDIAVIQTLPHEKREKRMQILLDSVSDGFLFIDEAGCIVLMNSVAHQVLGISPESSLGRRITDLQLPDYTVLECLSGRSFVNVKKDIITKTGRLQLFVTCKPITDSRGRIIGAVEIMKDMKEIKSLAHALLKPRQITFSDIIGESRAVKDALSFAQKIARTDSYVSIQGESGTGKELFAAAIHSASGRSGPFVPVNCAALPEHLLESELFGFVGGSFTGASKEGKPGLFEVAQGGTIFLDEITELPLALQSKLLRTLQEKTVRRIGGTQEIPVNARLITATNKRLEQMVQERTFREDLYYRINVLPIRIPPLRGRPEDIPLLAEHFLMQLNPLLDKPIAGFTREALAELAGHSWPGNVRELRNVIERSAILCSGGEIDVDVIMLSFDLDQTRREIRVQGPATAPGASLHDKLQRYERQIIEEALSCSKSIRQAAATLGLSHTALLKKLKKES